MGFKQKGAIPSHRGCAICSGLRAQLLQGPAAQKAEDREGTEENLGSG